MLAGVSATHPADAPSLRVVRAADRLVGGSVLAATDLEVQSMAVADLPDGALTDAGSVVGHTLTAPVARGQVLTTLALLSAAAPPPPGRVVAPLRLADVDLAELLRPGDRVDVVAADPQSSQAAVVAHGVRVVTVPAREADATATSGALVLVEASLVEATGLARAAAVGTLTVVWR